MAEAEVSRGRKVAAAAIFGALATALLFAVVRPVALSLADARDEAHAEGARFAALQGKRRDIPELEARLRALRALETESPLLFAAATPNVAAEAFGADVRAIAAAHAVDLDALRPAGASDDRGVRAVRLDIVARVPRERLAGFLAALEGHAPPIVLDRVRLSASEGGASTDDPRIAMAASLRAFVAAVPPPRSPR